MHYISQGELIHAMNGPPRKKPEGITQYPCKQGDYQATMEDYLTIHQKAGHVPSEPAGYGQP